MPFGQETYDLIPAFPDVVARLRVVKAELASKEREYRLLRKLSIVSRAAAKEWDKEKRERGGNNDKGGAVAPALSNRELANLWGLTAKDKRRWVVVLRPLVNSYTIDECCAMQRARKGTKKYDTIRELYQKLKDHECPQSQNVKSE